MSKRPITHEALRTLAFRCETAQHKRCKCRCGGALHGTKHSEEWIDDLVWRERVAEKRAPDQIDWVGYAGFEKFL